MSMIDAQPLTAPLPSAAPAEPAAASPRPTRSNYLWEAAKTVVAVATFTAMLLPLAFPSRANTQARFAPVAAAEAPPAATKVQSQKAAVSPAKSNAVQLPVKKPAPKTS
jgi:hypothetical protein